MKTKWRRLFTPALTAVLCLFIFLLSVHVASGEADSGKAERELTLMIYMCGSNLESQYGSASADFREMLEAGLDPNVSALVMMGGTSAWQMALDENSTTIMEIGTRGTRKIREAEKANMGDPATLAGFLQYAREQRPAKQYALILWDHGGGPLDGLCWDEQYGTDHLTMAELTEALQKAGFEQEKLGWIGFDACLMSSAEVASALVPYADYMISSQAEEPASGWNYSFLRGLGTDRNPEETGNRIIDAYFSAEENTGRDLTLACIRLSAIGELAVRMDEFFSELTGMLTRDSFPDISRMRLTATGFGRAGETLPGENGYDLVDLLSLTRSYASRSPERARRVEEALEQAVVRQRSNVEGSCGLSVYHPWRNREKYRSDWQAAYTGLAFCTGYTRYVNTYGGIMLGDHLVLWDRMDRISAFREDDSAYTRITAELSAEQIANTASARLVILARNLYDTADESYYLVYRSPAVQTEEDRLSASYDGRHLRAVNASGYTELTGALSYQVTEEGIYQIRLYPFDKDGNRSEQPILAEYILDDSEQFRLKDYLVLDPLTGAWSSRAEVDLSGYAGVTFLNEYRVPTVNGRNELLSFDQWQTDEHADTHRKARYDKDRTDFIITAGTDLLRAEALYAAFEIIDTQGYRVMTSLVPLDGGGVTEVPVSVPEKGSLPRLEGQDLDISCSVFLQPSPNLESARIILNLSLRNPLDRDLTFLLTDVRLNGKETDAGALNAQGTGGTDQNGRKALAPGETSAASLVFRYGEIFPLTPDVSLTEIDFSLFLGTVENGTSELKGVVPFRMTTDIPLTSFYPETDVLPPESLIAYGQETGALGPETEMRLFHTRDCGIFLRGFYVTDGNIILRLRYENTGTVSRHLFLGNAKLDGRPAEIGQTTDPGAAARNRRAATYRLSLPAWDAPLGVYRILAPGESIEEYVSVKPGDPGMTAARRLTFQAYWYDTDKPGDAVLFSEAEILSVEAAPLEEGIMGIAPAADYTVTEGQMLPAGEHTALSEDLVPDAGESADYPLHVSDPDGDPITGGFYALFRRVSSDAELAEMNILNPILEATGEPLISFAGGREWLIYEALGTLTPEEDGSASARFRGLLPSARTGDESFRMTPVYIHEDSAGRLLYDQIGNHFGFNSVTFPGAVLETAVGYLSLAQDTETGRVSLADRKQIDGSYPMLGEMTTQAVFLIPADATGEEMLAFLNGDLFDAPYRLRQYQRMKTSRISFSLDAVPDPERYEAAYLYATEGGYVCCTRPEPLVK